MAVNDKNKPKNWTLRSMEKKMRLFPKIEPPESLETKLMAILQTHPPPIRYFRPAFHVRLARFVASAAAAVFILSLILMINYGLSTGSSALFAQFDTSLSYPAYDSNYFFVSRDNNAADRIFPANILGAVPSTNDFNQ